MSKLYSIAIIAVPERADMVKSLLARLRSVAPGVTTDLYFDHAREGVWRNTRRAYLQDHGLPFRLIMQEDGWPALDFGAAIERMITVLTTRHSEFIVGLYSNQKSIRAKAAQSAYAYVWEMWGVANLFASTLLRPMVAFADQYEWPGSTPLLPAHNKYAKRPNGQLGLTDDCWPPVYCKLMGIPFMATTTTLVQHIGSSRSTLGHSFSVASGKNISPYYIGDTVSALTIDWTRLPKERSFTPDLI